MLTPSILAGTTTRKEVSKELVGVAGALGMAAALAAIPVVGPGIALVGGTSAWLMKAIKDKNRKEMQVMSKHWDYEDDHDWDDDIDYAAMGYVYWYGKYYPKEYIDALFKYNKDAADNEVSENSSAG